MFGQINFSSAVKAGLWGTLVMTIMMYGLPPMMGLPAMDIMAWIGFLNDLFYDRSYIAGLGELSISVCA